MSRRSRDARRTTRAPSVATLYAPGWVEKEKGPGTPLTKSMSSSARTAKAAFLDAFTATERRTAAPRTDALAESTRGLKVRAAMLTGGKVLCCGE